MQKSIIAVLFLATVAGALAANVRYVTQDTCTLTDNEIEEYRYKLQDCGCGVTCTVPSTPTPIPSTPKPTAVPVATPPPAPGTTAPTAPPAPTAAPTAPPKPPAPSMCLSSRSPSDCHAAVKAAGRQNQYCDMCKQNAKDMDSLYRCYGCVVQAYSQKGIGFGDLAAEECHLNAYDGATSVDCSCNCIGVYDVSSCGEYCHNCAGNEGCLCCVMYYTTPVFMLNEASKCVNGPSFYPAQCK